MSRLSKSEKILVTLLVVMLISYLYYQFILSPIVARMSTVKTSVAGYKEELNELKLLAASNKRLSEEVQQFKIVYDEYINIIPNNEREPQILKDLKEIADNNGIELNSLNIGLGVEYSSSSNGEENNGTVTQSDGLRTMAVPIILIFNGGYDNVMSFLNSMEQSSRITEITTVNIAPTADEESGSSLTVTLNASIIYISDGTASERYYDFNNGTYGKDNPFN